MQLRTQSAAEALGPIQDLSPWRPGMQHQQVTVNARGDAVSVWAGNDDNSGVWHITGRALSATGALGPTQRFSRAYTNAFEPQVTVDAEGNAVVAWHGYDGMNWRIQARTLSATGVLGPIWNLSAAHQNAFNVQLGTSSDGTSVFVWRRFDGSHWRIQTRALMPGGVLGPVLDLSRAWANALDPQVGVDAAGNAVFVWRFLGGLNSHIQARALSAAGALGALQTVTKHRWKPAYAPQVAVDPVGDAVLVWYQADGTYYNVNGVRLSAAGVLGPRQHLSIGPQEPTYSPFPQVGIDAAGAAAFAWMRFDPGTSTWQIETRTLSETGVLGPTQALSSGPPGRFPEIAVNANGNAAVVWELRRDPLIYTRIQAARGSVDGASLR
jgi:hypothetical protein